MSRLLRAAVRSCVIPTLLCLVAAAAIAGHHVGGKWLLVVELDGQGGEATFELEEKEGGKLTGTYTGALGEEEVSGTVDGNRLEFSFESQAGKIRYKGTVEDGTMKGECSYGELGSGTFEGKKQG